MFAAWLSVLVLPLVGFGVLAAVWLVLYPPLPADLGGAENLDAGAERVRIPVGAGDALDGWLLRGEGRGVLLLLHGHGRTHARIWRYGGFLSRAGYSLLAIDFRSSRLRGRLPTTLGHHELDDAQAALDWLKRQPRLGVEALGVLGESLGGSVALVLAARNPEVAAVVVDGAFAHGGRALEDACERWAGLPRRPTAAFLRWLARRVTGRDPGSLDVVPAAAALAERPVMLVHCLEDDRLSAAHAVSLWHAAGGKDPLWLIHGAGHNEGWRWQPGLYEELVLAFLEPPLRGTGAGLPGGPRATAVVRPRSWWSRGRPRERIGAGGA